MTDELKFTPEYIARSRKANGGPWVFSETREALDEIERLQSQLAARDALIERLVEAGQILDDIADIETAYLESEMDAARDDWRTAITEYRASKNGGAE